MAQDYGISKSIFMIFILIVVNNFQKINSNQVMILFYKGN